MNNKQASILGISLIVGLFIFGYILGESLIKFKLLERTVVVKGLAQKEVNSNVVIWPITYIRADNNLELLYASLEQDTQKIVGFLIKQGFTNKDISISQPSVTDKIAQNYNSSKVQFRYSAIQTITLYTKEIDKARKSMQDITQLGKKGITLRANFYEDKPEYKFTKLNEIKPQMIEAATRNARASAQKFAEDSQSKLGKIKSARQGQFSVFSRDKNTPNIKKVRVVSTIEYYLTD